ATSGGLLRSGGTSSAPFSARAPASRPAGTAEAQTQARAHVRLVATSGPLPGTEDAFHDSGAFYLNTFHQLRWRLSAPRCSLHCGPRVGAWPWIVTKRVWRGFP